MEELVDAFLYLSPKDLALREPLPPDFLLEADYRMELRRRNGLEGVPQGAPSSPDDFTRNIVQQSENPVFVMPKSPDMSTFVQHCLDLKSGSTTK